MNRGEVVKLHLRGCTEELQEALRRVSSGVPVPGETKAEAINKLIRLRFSIINAELAVERAMKEVQAA